MESDDAGRCGVKYLSAFVLAHGDSLIFSHGGPGYGVTCMAQGRSRTLL